MSDASSGGGYAVGTGRGKKKPRKKKPAYRLPNQSTPRGDAPATRPDTSTGRPRRYVLPNQSTPRGDAPATRKQDLKKAERHKRSTQYKRAVKQSYKSRTVAERRQRIDKILKTPVSKRSREDRAILETHRRRAKSDRRQMVLQILTDRQREILDEFKGGSTYKAAMTEARKRRAKQRGPVLRGTDYAYETDERKLAEMGFKPEGTLDKLMKAPIGALVSGVAFGEATYHDPIGVPTKTAKQFVQALPAVPGALKDMVTDPVDTVEEAVAGFSGRSGEKYKDRVAKIRKEGGLEYAGDAIIVTGAGSAATKLLSPGARKRGARPRVRVSGDVVKDAPNRGALGDAIGTAAQRRSAAKAEKRLREAEAGGRPIDAVQREVAVANRRAGRVVESLGLNAAARQTRHTAKQRGRAVYGMKRDQGRRVAEARKQIDRLSRKEKRAFYYAAAFGIRTADQARELLPKLRDNIAEHRIREGIQVRGSMKKSDMLPDIEKILRSPEAHFTDKLGAIIEELRADSVRAGREDPSLKTATQRLRRRYAPLAELLGLQRGISDADATDWHYVPGEDDFARAAAARPAPDVPEDVLDADVVGLSRPIAGVLERTSSATSPKQRIVDDLAGVDLEDLPGEIDVPGQGRMRFRSNKEIQDIAATFGEHPTRYVDVDPEFGARVAQAFEEMEHNPNDPEVKASYDALKRETLAQYEAAVKAGYEFEFYPEGADPYPNSPREAVLDLIENKHMYVYPTEKGFGTEGVRTDHPLLEDSGIRWNGKTVLYNDVFRAIHDFYGHAKEGVGFRAAGEDNAWRQHAAMFSPEARRAMTTETRGQNSWVNFGPHGEANRTANQADTVFADQKAGLLPEWVSDPGTDRPLPTPQLAPERVPGAHLAAAVANVLRGEIPAGARPAPRKGYWEERPSPKGYFDEADAAFVRRVAERVDELGLAKPLYFKSERYSYDPDFGAAAVGGVRAMANDQRYRGTNLREGFQDTDTTQYLRGLSRNIKRKHNWNLVADILQANGLPEFSRAGGFTVSELRERLARAGVDLQSAALWNPGVFRAQAVRQASDGDERLLNAEEFGETRVAAALGNAVVRIDKDGRAIDGFGNPIPEEMLLRSSGWHAVPAAVLRELEAQMKPSHWSGRAWDIAKGKASRMMLLTANLPWLGFQVASNTAMAATATGLRSLNPANWLGAARWWNELTPDQQQRAGALFGLDATGADTKQVKMGAAVSGTGTLVDIVNAYRMFKAHPFWHSGVAAGRGPSISELNPLELMAKADRGQNNVFRILAGYSKAKREAVKRMGENMGRADRAQLKLMSTFQKPPAEMLRELADDPDLLEEHADSIADWMGDYTTLTAGERKIWNRTFMFYPYLRYSLRLLFYTMPVKHPVVTAVLAELAELRMDELEELFGEDSLPWNSGKIYFGEDGDVTAIDLKKANPALNAPIDALRMESPGALLGVTPPFVTMLANQLAGKDLFFGRDYRVQGRAAEYGQKIPLGALDVRARILANDISSLLYPVRLAGEMEFNPATMSEDERLGLTQGDDSLVFAPRPIRYKGSTEASKMKGKNAERQAEFEEDNENIVNELFPLLPEPSRDAERAAEEEKVQRLERKTAKKRKRGSSKAKYFGSGGSGGSTYFGAGD